MIFKSLLRITALCFVAAISIRVEAVDYAFHGLGYDVSAAHDTHTKEKTWARLSRYAVGHVATVSAGKSGTADELVSSPQRENGEPCVEWRFRLPPAGELLEELEDAEGGGYLKMWASLFSPFVVFDTNDPQYHLASVKRDDMPQYRAWRERFEAHRAEQKKKSDSPSDQAALEAGVNAIPLYAAYRAKDGVRVIANPGTLQGDDMSEPWLLFWYDGLLPEPCPMLAVLERKPDSVVLNAEGVKIICFGSARRLVLTPLFGGVVWPARDEVARWKNAFPEELAARCRLLSQVSRHAPLCAEESMEMDRQSGSVSLVEEWDFMEIADEWETEAKKIAFFPPYAGLALWGQTPARVEGSLIDLDYVVFPGRMAGVSGVDKAVVTLPGVSALWEKRPKVKSVSKAAEAYRALLEAEILKMADAGHLRPGYCGNGIHDRPSSSITGDFMPDYWSNPADLVYTLCRAMPLLSLAAREKAEAYLRSEFEEYPPHTIRHIGWKDGARREKFPYPPEVEAGLDQYPKTGRPRGNLFKGWDFPPHNLYAVAEYAALFGDARELYEKSKHIMPPPEQEWAFGMSWACSGPMVLNARIAGLIGCARLAAMAGDEAEAENSGLRLTRLMLLKAAMMKNPLSLAQTGWNAYTGIYCAIPIASHAATLDEYGPGNNVFQPVKLGGIGDRYHVTLDFIHFTPELGAFLHDYALEGVRASIESLSWQHPYWFVVNAQNMDGEGSTIPYYYYVAGFQAKALALQENGDDLEKYLDVPACELGDLFYIQNLCALIEAYSGVEWE